MVQPRKTRPFITERLLMGRKESNQTKQKSWLAGEEFNKPVKTYFLKMSEQAIEFTVSTVKPVLSGHSIKYKKRSLRQMAA